MTSFFSTEIQKIPIVRAGFAILLLKTWEKKQQQQHTNGVFFKSHFY